MSYHDMTARDVEREQAEIGHWDEYEQVVYERSAGTSTNASSIVVILLGAINDVTDEFRFEAYSFQSVTWMFDKSKNHCALKSYLHESLSLAIVDAFDLKEPNPFDLAKAQEDVWKNVAKAVEKLNIVK